MKLVNELYPSFDDRFRNGKTISDEFDTYGDSWTVTIRKTDSDKMSIEFFKTSRLMGTISKIDPDFEFEDQISNHGESLGKIFDSVKKEFIEFYKKWSGG